MNQVSIYHDPNCNLFKDSIIGFSKDSYIVSLNNQIIGHFNLIFDTFDENSILINYELLRDFRGLGIGNSFYQIITTLFSRLILIIILILYHTAFPPRIIIVVLTIHGKFEKYMNNLYKNC